MFVSSCRSLTHLTLALAFAVLASNAAAATYEVGPGQPFETPAAVPWESLQPGDVVRIHWRATPYRDKWVIARAGTATAPIVVQGVPNAAGERPIIDGNGATTRLALDSWGESRAVIKIGGASIPADTMPRYIVIENLDVRSARPPYTFVDDAGTTQSYSANAAAIWIEKGEDITLRNNRLYDSGNGLFVSSADPFVSRDIFVAGNAIFDNGNVGSLYEHNAYSEALGITYDHNYFGPTKSGAGGNNLKDRSAGLVVRYNWIEGGNRQLDLVETDSAIVQGDLSYRSTFVYGNVLVETDGSGNRQITHYGGDNGTTSKYRKGTLYFYNNTMVSYRTDRTTLFRLSTNEERADVRNNLFYVVASGTTLSLLDATGILDLTHNWFKPGHVSTFGTLSGTINDAGTSVVSSTPGFRIEAGQDFRLATGSVNVNAGTWLSSAVSLPEPTVAWEVRAPPGEPAKVERWRPGHRRFRARGRSTGGSRHRLDKRAERHCGIAIRDDVDRIGRGAAVCVAGGQRWSSVRRHAGARIWPSRRHNDSDRYVRILGTGERYASTSGYGGARVLSDGGIRAGPSADHQHQQPAGRQARQDVQADVGRERRGVAVRVDDRCWITAPRSLARKYRHSQRGTECARHLVVHG